MKNLKIEIALSLLLLAATACSLTGTPTSPTITPPTLPPPTAALTATSVPFYESVTVTSVAYDELQTTTPMYEITGQTPQLQGSDDPRVTTFNAAMQQLTQNEVDAFKKNMQSVVVIPEVPNSSFDFHYELLSSAGNKIVSIKFSFEGFTSGQAHPYHYTITVNYDLEQSKELTLDQLFASNANYLQPISDYCKTQLATRDIGFQGDFTKGADPLPENYKNWNITADGLAITFDEYQVAPYAAGPQTVVVPYNVLSQVIQNPGPLTPFVH